MKKLAVLSMADADLRLLSDNYEALELDTDFDSLAVTLQINDLWFEVTIF